MGFLPIDCKSFNCASDDFTSKKKLCNPVDQLSNSQSALIYEVEWTGVIHEKFRGVEEKQGNLQNNAMVSSCNLLCNTDFEDVKLVPLGGFGFFNQNLVSCWNTTATDNQIEVWGSGFGGVPAYSGSQFVELNANMVSTLFQNFSASLGSTVEISFAHRGRAGTDVMSLEIGPVGGPYQNLGDFSAGNTAWVFHTLRYTFPVNGSTAYNIRFKSVSAAGGPTVGNFLDAISIRLEHPTESFTMIQPDCPNDHTGSITVKVRGGSSPYSYLWMTPLNAIDSTVTGLASGIYQLELKDFYGCGDTLTIRLDSKHTNDTVEITKQVCGSFTWAANGQTYTQSGSYSAMLQNQFGCDSLVKLNLELLPLQSSTENIQSCNSYTWPVNGRTYFVSGMYQDTISNVFGCDSVLNLNLSVLPEYWHLEQIKMCKEYTWPVNGHKYTQSGRYSDTLFSISGCDSIIALDLDILPDQMIHQSAHVCDTYFWPANGMLYTQSGIYTDTLITISGCDSIVVLDLEIYPVQNKKESVKICDSYRWPVNGVKYTSSGLYSDTLKTRLGCDSILSLDLEILPRQYINESVQNCDSYFWPVNGIQYTSSGFYTDTFSNVNGCDSIRTLNLQIRSSTFHTDTMTACDNYTWPANGITYDQSGLYKKTFQNQAGCDSVLNLDLTIHSSSKQVQMVTACSHYVWPANGQYYSNSGIYKMQLVNNQLCDSILILNLVIHPDYQFNDTIKVCDRYTWPVNGKTYQSGGRYQYNARSHYGCDSVFSLVLEIDSSYIKSDTVTAIENYVWPVNREFYEKSGVYEEHFISVEGCDSIRILFLEIRRKGSVFLPNVFSPNGDGINDKWIVYSSPEITKIDRMRIYDRWGEMLFELSDFPPNDPAKGWDGSSHDLKMLPAVFVYTVEWTDLAGERHFERGDVTLVR
jgi:gliding motility-associated-like protein